MKELKRLESLLSTTGEAIQSLKEISLHPDINNALKRLELCRAAIRNIMCICIGWNDSPPEDNEIKDYRNAMDEVRLRIQALEEDPTFADSH